MTKQTRGEEPGGAYSFDGLDRVLHEKARLGILSSLVANPQGLVFSELKDLCRLTDGNLNRHMQVLQEAKLIEVWKGQRGKRPQTLVRLTEQGRERFLSYVEVLEQIVSQTLQAAQSTDAAAKRLKPGWSPS